jgi:hypothetical protein
MLKTHGEIHLEKDLQVTELYEFLSEIYRSGLPPGVMKRSVVFFGNQN